MHRTSQSLPPTTRRLLPLVALLVLPALTRAQATTPTERGTLERTLTVDSAKREYLLHVPRSYDEKKQLPLVIFLHGRGSSGRQAARHYGFTPQADERGFLVAYPTALGRPRSWEPGYGGRKGAMRDVAFLRTLIEELSGAYRVDPRRVYVCGHSSGGIMSYAAAAHLSDRVAAIGVVAGTIGFTRGRGTPMTVPNPKHPVSVIAFHCKDDRVVPYDRERGAGARWNFFVSAPKSVAFWVEHNGCGEDAEAREVCDGNGTMREWSNGKGTEVVFYDIEKGGHGWPRGRHRGTETPRATDLMVKFFLARSRPAKRGKPRRKVLP